MTYEVSRGVLLCRGLIDEEGERHRWAVLRGLNGWQETAAAEMAGRMRTTADRVAAGIELIAGCLESIGAYSPVSAELVAELSRGDRQLLALELRRNLFGPRLFLTLTCPSPVCRQQADLDVEVDELLPNRDDEEPEWIISQTPEGRVEIRTPTGRDDLAVAAGSLDRRERSALLFSRLVGRLGDRGKISIEEWAALRPETRQAVALALAVGEVAPGLAIVSRCPSCAAALELLLDPFDLLGRELRLGVSRLEVEVHCLAFHYSWTEDAILSLPRTRRWRYLELLRRQMDGVPLESASEFVGA